MLVGYRVHGIRRPEDLTSDMARNQARTGWLTDAKYLAILANPHEYQDLILQGGIGDTIDSILYGAEECFFMCDSGLDDTFGAEAVVTDTYGVRFGNDWRLNVVSTYNMIYEKREYTMRNSPDLKLVHYQPNTDASKLDKVQATLHANALNRAIQEHGQSSGEQKRGVLNRINRGRGHN